ncbi:esterase FE4-like [Phymastichus coffea]|uniref:esterase FE4-like n=1 Tax=Phymastichus coffea TaxID=108790 RepID=UPI00273B52F8|nr:esterase FE4-like [Phymastichus coffea]
MKKTVVKTKYGRIRGSIQKSIEGYKYYAFKGVPYAKPPIGDLRFKDPVPAEKWQGIRDALECGPMCAQHEIVANITGGSEDCLYLNVYTKSIEPNIRRPVMVWIHGGGFIFGSGNDVFYGPDYFMKKDIVLVTINYRLGVLGFLNLQDEVASGNQGLKDQIMALRWVRDNIANFGGDPENVTIFGESAGGASVHYLTVSPLAKGLFHKAISQSGSIFNPWASIHGDPKLAVYKLCELLGKKTTNHKEIVQFLRTIDTMSLIEAQGKIMSEDVQKKTCPLFGPAVDNKSSNPFLPVPFNMAAQKGAHVPYMIGYTDREGTFFHKIAEKSYDYETRDKNFAEFLHPNCVEMLKHHDLTENDLKKIYFKSERITQERSEKLIDMLSDLMIVHGVQKAIKIQAEHNSAPTYMYQFTYDKGYNFTKSMFNSDVSGATHMDDLLYQFSIKVYDKLKLEPFKKDSKNYRVMEQMIELWTNFAKYGRPTPTVSKLVPIYWQPVIDGTVLRYLNIGEELRMEKMLNIEERFSNYKNTARML